MMALQQLRGIDGMLYYAPLLVRQRGIFDGRGVVPSARGGGNSDFCFDWPCYLAVCLSGQRPVVLVFGAEGDALARVCAPHHHRRGLLGGDTDNFYIFVVAYCMAWAVGSKIFAYEVWHIASRATATSLGLPWSEQHRGFRGCVRHAGDVCWVLLGCVELGGISMYVNGDYY